MQMNYAVPGLLFPAISFFMLACTQRFLAMTSLIRVLHDRYRAEPAPAILGQIRGLRFRLSLIRHMQVLGASSLLLNTASVFTLFIGAESLAPWLFGSGLVLMLSSIGLSVWEIHISMRAIDLQISELETASKGAPRAAEV